MDIGDVTEMKVKVIQASNIFFARARLLTHLLSLAVPDKIYVSMPREEERLTVFKE